MKLNRIVLPVFLLIAAHAAYAQPKFEPKQKEMAQRLQQIMDRSEFRRAFFGIEFYSLDRRRPLYTLNADKLFVPASTTKLLTEGTALELLGADYRFRTKVYRTGAIGADGTLDGNIILVASGDPNLSGRIKADDTLAFENQDHSYQGDPNTRAVPGDPLLVIRRLAQQIADREIKRITGHVIVDVSLFPEGQRELGTNVVLSPIVVNDNLIDMMVRPGASAGAPLDVKISPATSYLTIINRATTGAPDSRPSIRMTQDTENADGLHTVTVTGSMPAGIQGILYAYRVPRPSRFAEVVLTEALREKGISVELGPNGARRDTQELAQLYTPGNMVAEHVSPPMREEVKVTLKVSQNLHASMAPLLLRALLAPNEPGRTGFDLEREFLQRAGLDTLGARQGDGAGGDAHFTPEFMVGFLEYMSRQKSFDYFYNALPILGRDGTLFDIQSQSPAAGHVRAKTGTFSVGDPLNRRLLVTAKGLAGYITTKRGQKLVFALYVNNVSVPLEPDAVKNICGQALGELAAAAYEFAR